MATGKVVILARGLGRRMQQAAADTALSADASRMADAGLKGLIPLAGRPFLDYLFAAIVQAGYQRACLVIGPDSTPLRSYGQSLADRSGLPVEFAVQVEPLGTANALAAAEEFSAGESVVMLNSDNLITAESLRVLREARSALEPSPASVPPVSESSASAVTRSANLGPMGLADLPMPGGLEAVGLMDPGYQASMSENNAPRRAPPYAVAKTSRTGQTKAVQTPLDDEPIKTDDDDEDTNGDTAYGVHTEFGVQAGFVLGFDRDALINGGNIPPERVRRFAVLQTAEQGRLARVVEKPENPDAYMIDGRLLVSMNCWQMPAAIFEACRAIGPSPRGEFEITDAVQHLVETGQAEFRVLPRVERVFDLTGREDISALESHLKGLAVPFSPPSKMLF